MLRSTGKLAMEKVLIVGSGLTGACTASLIRHELPHITTVSIWDKSNGIGGRMSTSRSGTCPGGHVDLGAQYISASPEFQQKHKQVYSELEGASILRQIDVTSMEGHVDRVPGMRHYVVPDGVSALVKYFVNKSGVSVSKSELVRDVSIKDGKATVMSDQGHTATVDAVVLTLPVPQILQLQGSIQQLIDSQGIRPKLEKVSYSSRFAVGLFYPRDTVLDASWSAKYFTGNPCVRYVSIDNKKRGKGGDEPASICVHTSAEWGQQHVEEDKDVAAREILTHLTTLLPWLPQPAEVKGHKWRYSQVARGYEGSPGCVVVSRSPLIILAGDGFTHSNFDGCYQSAQAVVRTLQDTLVSKV